jgi:hypothetical protein
MTGTPPVFPWRRRVEPVFHGNEKTMIPPDQDFAARVRGSFGRQQAMALLGAQMTEVQPGMTQVMGLQPR